MLDFVFLAMFLVLAVMAVSIYLAKYRRQYELHKRLQVVLAAVLLVTVVAFEVDLHFITQDWEALAEPSPYFLAGHWCAVWVALVVHLCVAIPTPLLWVFVIVRALRQFPRPAAPGAHSRQHVFWARLAAVGMFLTAATGWVFYWLAFVAT